MNLTQSISTCMRKYVTFSGRATRSEFWWFFLFCMLVGLLGSVIDAALGLDAAIGGNGVFTTLIQLATFLPSIAVGSRRLHDTNRSGWWQLLWIVVFIGWIPLIIWLASTSKNENNRFGDEPTD